MRKLICCVMLPVMVLFLSVNSFADRWDDLIAQSYRQRLSKSKRQTRSGQRILREKIARIKEIDRTVPGIISRGEYGQAEVVLEESLRLTIEFMGSENNMPVAERFALLGMLCYRAGNYQEAKGALRKTIDIASPIIGNEDIRLAGVYSVLAVIYEHEGRRNEAIKTTETLFSISVAHYGPNSPEAGKVKDLLRQLYAS